MLREVFQNGVVAADELLRFLDRAVQMKANLMLTLPAKRKEISLQQRGLVHQAMGVMLNSVDAALRNHFARKKSFLHLHPVQGPGKGLHGAVPVCAMPVRAKA